MYCKSVIPQAAQSDGYVVYFKLFRVQRIKQIKRIKRDGAVLLQHVGLSQDNQDIVSIEWQQIITKHIFKEVALWAMTLCLGPRAPKGPSPLKRPRAPAADWLFVSRDFALLHVQRVDI